MDAQMELDFTDDELDVISDAYRVYGYRSCLLFSKAVERGTPARISVSGYDKFLEQSRAVEEVDSMIPGSAPEPGVPVPFLGMTNRTFREKFVGLYARRMAVDG